MKAVVIRQAGDPSVLTYQDYETPGIKANEVLIKVTAAGINRADIAQRMGRYPAPQGTVQDIPGLEASGTIEAVGADVSEWKVGDKVCALLPGGGYAEYVQVDAGSCLPIPKGMSLEEAGAIPEVLFTVWHNIFQKGQLQPRDKALIYGGSGGIGSMAIQLVHLFGAKAITLASTAEKAQYCKELGATQVVNYKEEEPIKAIEGSSVAVILDSVGGNYLTTNLEVLKPEGHLVYINAMEGKSPDLDIKKIMRKRIIITGSTLRARPNDFKRALRDEIREKAFPLLESGQFKNLVKHRFSFAEAQKAHELLESRNFFGKIILTP